jgi:hypothetical protein
MGWSRRRRKWKTNLPPREERFNPALHARSRSTRGWDWRPRQCACCNRLFVPKNGDQVHCLECLEELANELLDNTGVM